MKKLFKRCVAYFIDMLVILLITQCLSGIPQLNRQLDDYNKYYDDYVALYGEWVSFKGDLISNYEDKELDDEEYNSLIKDHENYVEVLNKYYKDNKLTKDNYDKLNKEIDKVYYDTYEDIYFKIEKNSIVYMIIYLVVVFGYFVFFNKYTNGQTLGKKLMRLKIVNNTDDRKDVSIWSYIIRTLILYQPIYYLIRLIGINFMNAGMYYDVTSMVYSIQGYLEMIIIAMMMLRLDGRGPQDLLARTRVALYDKNGNEIKDKINTIISDKLFDIKNNSKKVIDNDVMVEENTSIEQTKNKKIKSNKKRSKKVIDEEPTK